MNLAEVIGEHLVIAKDISTHLKHLLQLGPLTSWRSVSDTSQGKDARLDVVLVVLTKLGYDFEHLGGSVTTDRVK
jgi:hypothetical protein